MLQHQLMPFSVMNQSYGGSTDPERVGDLKLRYDTFKSRDLTHLFVRELLADGLPQSGSISVPVVVAATEVLKVGEPVVPLVAVHVVYISSIRRSDECARDETMDASRHVLPTDTQTDCEIASP